MYNIGDKVKIVDNHETHEGNCPDFNSSYKGIRGTITGKNIVREGYYTYKIRADEGQNMQSELDLSWNFGECMFSLIEPKKTKEVLKKSVPDKQFIIKPRKITKIPYKSFKLGIELETLVPYENKETVYEKIKEQALLFALDSDSSIETDDDTSGVEFKGSEPMSYTDLKTNTRKLLQILNDNEVFVNTSCGFHLHISNKRFFNDKVMNRIIYTWSAIEDFLLATQPRSRLNNSYCKRYLLEYVTHEKNGRKLLKGKQKLISQLSGERYRTLNLTSLAGHGTIEIRLHAGTTQYKKVIAWIDLMLAFFTYCLKDYNHKEVENMFYQKISEQKIDNVCNLLGLPEKDILYFKGRIHKMLFDRLAKQQESAGKIIKNIKTIQKARERVDKASAHFREIDNAYQQEFRILQAE